MNNIRAVSPLVNEVNRTVMNNSAIGFKPTNVYINGNFNT